MDHMPLQGPNVIRVPYLEGEAWDHEAFDSYGERRGLSQGFDVMRRPEEELQILQAWFFFGLIEQIMRLVGIACNADDFVSSDERGLRINTRKLPTLLVKFMDYERRQETGRAERRQKMISLLQTVVEVTRTFRFLESEEARIVDKSFVHDKGGPVFLGISMANLALNEMCKQLYDREFDSDACRIRSGIGLTFLWNKMLAEGWCLGVGRRLGNLGDREFLYLAYTHGPWHLFGSDHSSCNYFCAYDRIDESTYEPQHPRQGCNCAMIESDREKMESIIDSGGIPICRLRAIPRAAGELPELVLQIEPASDEHPFIAISHVWAHGLGNPDRNGLPTCAVFQIHRTTAAIWEELSNKGVQHTHDEDGRVQGFWMDTLCVPVHKSEFSKRLRRKAIAQMREIYNGAAAVCVWDQVLRQRQTLNLTETLISISLSPWARRLWTFQEAAFAKRIYVLLKSGVLADFDVLVARIAQSLFTSRVSTCFNQISIYCCANYHQINTSIYNSRLYSTILPTVLSLWKSLRPYTPESAIPIPFQSSVGSILSSSSSSMTSADVANILFQLPFRSTTRRSDETICISTILGMSVMPFLEVEAASDDELCDQRMIKLLSNLSILPASLVFSRGPKLTVPGFRWAPKTLLQSESGKISTTVGGWHAKFIPSKGLVCKMDAMIFSQSYSDDDIVNADQFLLSETGYLHPGPILVTAPPSDDYHGGDLCTTFPDHDSPASLFVLLFDDDFSDRLESLAMMCVVREKAAIEVLESEMNKGCSFNFSEQGDFTALVDGREFQSGSTIVLGDASYKKTSRVPADTWKAEDGQFVVECVKVMLGVRIKAHMEDIKINLPARLVQGKTWTLT